MLGHWLLRIGVSTKRRKRPEKFRASAFVRTRRGESWSGTRHAFWKVLSIVHLYSEYARMLTFENFYRERCRFIRTLWPPGKSCQETSRISATVSAEGEWTRRERARERARGLPVYWGRTPCLFCMYHPYTHTRTHTYSRTHTHTVASICLQCKSAQNDERETHSI